jgi:cytoskeletal protein RodZ
MTSAPAVLRTLFAGPSLGIIAAILVLAVAAIAAVLWMIRGLLVDPRAERTSTEFAGTESTESTESTGPMVEDAADAGPRKLQGVRTRHR